MCAFDPDIYLMRIARMASRGDHPCSLMKTLAVTDHEYVMYLCDGCAPKHPKIQQRQRSHRFFVYVLMVLACGYISLWRWKGGIYIAIDINGSSAKCNENDGARAVPITGRTRYTAACIRSAAKQKHHFGIRSLTHKHTHTHTYIKNDRRMCASYISRSLK